MGFSSEELQKETERLHMMLTGVHCDAEKKWNFPACAQIAPLSLKINRLKAEKEAIILAHSYVYPEIVYGVADFKSDSYALALEARHSKAKVIVFAGVVFMAETAKILCPEAQVVVPDIGSGCSLADSLTGDELKSLKQQYPHAAVVCYINSSAEVKAESDVCVTSSNVVDIIAKLPQKEILFVPDRLMADNIREQLFQRGIEKTIFSSQGTCEVHDQFSPKQIEQERLIYPELQVLSHPECTTEVTRHSDFVGSTGKMMEFVRSSEKNHFLLLTECGLVNRLEVEAPNKNFVAGCKLCPYMKLNSLEKIYEVLTVPRKEQIINVPKEIAIKAKKAIDRMFELTQ